MSIAGMTEALKSFIAMAAKIGRCRAVATLIWHGGAQTLEVRRKTAVFCAFVLGHKVPDKLAAVDVGLFGRCERCRGKLLVGRETGDGDPAAKGEVVCGVCPLEPADSDWNRAARAGRVPS